MESERSCRADDELGRGIGGSRTAFGINVAYIHENPHTRDYLRNLLLCDREIEDARRAYSEGEEED